MAAYHGTDRGFWSFDPELGAYWFSREIDYAEAMAEERGGDRVLSAYISMKNPMRISLPMGRFTDPAAEGPYIRRAKAEGYDGVIFDTDTDNPMMADTFYVVFRPEQIKSATENIGTFDPNNPDIPNSVFLPVYGLEHDYDRDPQRVESKALYQQAITWTNRILGAK